jgi:putative hydrolase of the HAD superfamily
MRGVRTAAVSNGTSDVRAMLGGSALGPLLDEIVLSAEAGLMKPGIKIYRYAAARLGVSCGQCVYVGDGTDDELHGAEAAGMFPIIFDVGEGRAWHGPRITSLVDVPMKIEVVAKTPPTTQNGISWSPL